MRFLAVKLGRMARSVRGMKDLYGRESDKFDFIFNKFRLVGERYGFGMIYTPILEYTDVFYRSIGDETDVVSKEMYTFLDKGEESVTLRPEGTAGVVRAIVCEHLDQCLPVKLMYCGEMFRYDRPQKGRFRQFRQFGLEHVGDKSPYTDAITIAIAVDCIRSIGFCDFKILVNSLGDDETRENYTKAIVKYFSRHEDRLSAESRIRLKKNPLRVLDSKNKQDVEICSMAPILMDYLSKDSRVYFNKVCSLLEDYEINYEINHFLVRGLDYYSHTAFEILPTSGTYKEAIGGGGRYDKLLAILGGLDVSGIGFAIGIDRLMLLMDDFFVQQKKRKIAVIPVSEGEDSHAFSLFRDLQNCEMASEFIHLGSLTKKMKIADRLGCAIAIILGSNEIQNNTVTVKFMNSSDAANKTRSIRLSDIINFLRCN
jgi:histidyl-tRNA synthetase